jgi:hypothetical protein
MVIHCKIKLGEVPLHLYPILAGFFLLKKQGTLNIELQKLKRNEIELPYNMLEVIVNGEKRVLYDVNDGYDNLLKENLNYVDFYNGLLEKYDFCFKRSFSSPLNKMLRYSQRILPLGLNYMASIKGNIAHYPMPQDPTKEKIKKLIRLLPITQHYNGNFHMNTFENVPQQDRNPKILFMARLWDINGEYEGQLSNDKREERAYINNFRASCIRLCRKEFGPNFFGGVNPTLFSIKNYKDLVVEDSKITHRKNYLELVKNSSICISTMGLHQSIGWKFAEYIAASRAIVTEQIHYELPGNISEGKNYLVFTTPEECIEKIYQLISNDNYRYEMSVNNYQYYHEFVRPDRLIMNTLFSVLRPQNEPEFHLVGGEIS